MMLVACREPSDDDDACDGEKQVWIGSLEVAGSGADEALSQLRCVELITGDLSVVAADVTSLRDLSSLIEVQGNLSIERNDDLTALTGLEALVQVKGQLSLRSDAALESLSALSSLHTVGSLELDGLPEVETLAGLEALRRVDGNLFISNSAKLRDLSALTALRGIAGWLELRHNERLTSAALPYSILDVGAGIRISDNPSLLELSDFGRFKGDGQPCGWEADVVISRNQVLQTIIVGDAHLYQACVDIRDNPSLRSVAAPFTMRLGSLTLSGLPRLTTLDFGTLQLDSLSITDTGLETLDGLNSAHVDCEITVNRNPALTSLGAFAASPHIAAVFFALTDNPKLPACEVTKLLAALPNDRYACTRPFTPRLQTDRTAYTEGNAPSASCN
jgi:hypothetical protein